MISKSARLVGWCLVGASLLIEGAGLAGVYNPAVNQGFEVSIAVFATGVFGATLGLTLLALINRR